MTPTVITTRPIAPSDRPGPRRGPPRTRTPERLAPTRRSPGPAPRRSRGHHAVERAAEDGEGEGARFVADAWRARCSPRQRVWEGSSGVMIHQGAEWPRRRRMSQAYLMGRPAGWPPHERRTPPANATPSATPCRGRSRRPHPVHGGDHGTSPRTWSSATGGRSERWEGLVPLLGRGGGAREPARGGRRGPSWSTWCARGRRRGRPSGSPAWTTR